MTGILCEYQALPEGGIRFRQTEVQQGTTAPIKEDSIPLRDLHAYSLGHLVNRIGHRSAAGEEGIDDFWKSFLACFSSFTSSTEVFIKSLKNSLNKYFDNNGNRNELGKKKLSNNNFKKLFEFFHKPDEFTPLIDSIRGRRYKGQDHSLQTIHGKELFLDKYLDESANLLEIVKAMPR